MRVSSLFFIMILIVTSGCTAQKMNYPGVSGDWQIVMTTHDVGKVRLIFNFDVYPQGMDTFSIDGYTEKNMDEKVLGFTKARLGRMAGSNFKNGSLIRLHKAILHRDSFQGVIITPFSNFYFASSLRKGIIDGVLRDGANNIVGTISGYKDPKRIPLDDYPSIINTALNIAEQKLYDPALTKSKSWIDFKEKLKDISKATNDDAALVLGFFYYARKLPFSHFALYVPADMDTTMISNQNGELSLDHLKNAAYLKIKSFGGSADAMDSVFKVLDSYKYKTLIVDMRDNAGGSIQAGMPFIRHLITDTTYGGILLTQKYFNKCTAPPPLKDYRLFPYFTEANYDLLIKGISEQPAISLKAYPQTPVFSGQVYILTNGNTASTCEPIVYMMKQQKRAIIVGQRTAGAMLNGETFSVNKDYKITIPTATYYTSDGFKIDQNGVTPDIELKKETDALEYVQDILLKKNN